MERKSLIPLEQGNVPASYGKLQPDGFFTRATFAWTVKQFQIGKPEDGILMRELPFAPILKFTGIRRNFENDYGAENVRPTCYSLDGKQGSTPRVERQFGDKTYKLYGECNTCAFNAWKSRGIWKGASTGGGKNCAIYTLILALIQTKNEQGIANAPEVCMIHVPSTGVKSVDESITAVVKAKGKQFEEVKWMLQGTGGGYQGKYMKAVPIEFFKPEEVEELRALRYQYREAFENYIYVFAQGGIEEENTVEGETVNA